MTIGRLSTFLIFLVWASSLDTCISLESADYELPLPWWVTEETWDLPPSAVRYLRDKETFRDQEIPDETPDSGSWYDFVVVGAGTAGAVLARRLSEIAEVRVLLIEVGPGEDLNMDVPLLAQSSQLSRIDWQYETEPSGRYCLGMTRGRCKYPRGRVVGGSSVLNYMLASRGHPADYDAWARMGNVGWSFRDVLPYFKKLETTEDPDYARDTVLRGTSGPLHLAKPRYQTPIARKFVEAGRELGYAVNNDYNGNGRIGFSYIQSTSTNGTRMSSNRAYLQPIKGRKNLQVTKLSLARKLLFNRDRTRVVGVEFVKDGEVMRVYARKEVILSAGAIGSPQLLMLSGIGPADHLRELGIDVIKNAPVGDNFMDHVSFAGLLYTVNESVCLVPDEIRSLDSPEMTDFLVRREGPFTVPAGCEMVAFLDVFNKTNTVGPPNVEFPMCTFTTCSDMRTYHVAGLTDEIFDKLCDGIKGKHTWAIYPMVLKPKSRGRLRLKDADVRTKPAIEPNFFSDPEDMKLMLAGIRVAKSVGTTTAMRTYGSRLHRAMLPGCEDLEYDSDAYWECTVRSVSYNIYHYSGTCKMAPENDPTAVVNPRLKVIGVDGLRVADGSIIPEIPAAHTNIPIYMIAEKAADIIKEDWGHIVND